MKRRLKAILAIFCLTFCVIVSPVMAEGTPKSTNAAGTVLNGDYVVVVNTNANPDAVQGTGVLEFDNSGESAPKAASNMLSEEGTDLYDNVQLEEQKDNAPAQRTFMSKLSGNLARAAVYEKGNSKEIASRNYTCIGVGEHCYVWLENSLKSEYDAAGKTDAVAADAISVYDGKPYKVLQSLNGGTFPSGSEPKLSILLESTNNGSSGYFQSMNDMTAVHINTSHGNAYKDGEMSSINGLLVHEGQHAIFQKKLGVSSDMGFRWINEALSVMSMDYTWGGSDPTGWLDRINGSVELRNGFPLVYSSYRDSTLKDYSLPYLFARYLADQKAKGYTPLDIYPAFYSASAGNSVECYMDAVLEKAYLNVTFKEALVNFYAATVAQQPEGVYGFYGDPVIREKIDYPVYMGEPGKATNLGGTAAIVLKTKNRSFTVPEGAGADIQFIAVDKAGTDAYKPTGNGTAENPYQIKTASDLNAINDYPEACFRLENDLNVADQATFTVSSFTGTLDGSGHAIKNLKKPLIGNLQSPGSVRNLTVEAAFNDEYSQLIGVIASNNTGTVADCVVTGSADIVLRGTSSVLPSAFGLVAGWNDFGGTISGCRTDADVQITLPTGCGSLGALTGVNAGRIENCYTEGRLVTAGGGSVNVGGLAGELGRGVYPGPTILNSYSVTVVTAGNNAIAGRLFGKESTPVRSDSVIASYALDGMKAVGATGMIADTFSRTDSQMKNPATYNRWDTGVWSLSQGSYPKFISGSDIKEDITVSLPASTCYVGEALQLYGAQITFDGKTAELTQDMVSGFDSSAAGEKTVNGNYKGKSFTFKVTVKAPVNVTDLTVSRPAKSNYTVGERFDPAGAVLMATIDGSPYHYLYSGYTVDKTEPLTSADTEATYTYGGQTVAQAIIVAGKEPQSIQTLTPIKDTYQEKDKLDLSGLKLQIAYNDGTKSEIFRADALTANGLGLFTYNGKAVPIEDVSTWALAQADDDAGLYVYVVNKGLPDEKGINRGEIFTLLATLKVKSLLGMDDQVISMTVSSKADETDPNFPTRENHYSTEALRGFEVGAIKTELISGTLPEGIESQLPGSGAGNSWDSFHFFGYPSTAGTYPLTYKIENTNTHSSIVVNFVIKVKEPSNDCGVKTFGLSFNMGGDVYKHYKGIIDGEKIELTIPSDVGINTLSTSSIVLSDPFATSSVSNGSKPDFDNNMQAAMIVTAPDKTTAKTYTIQIKQAATGATILSTPANLSYEDDTKTLSWNAVENAGSYQIELYPQEAGDTLGFLLSTTKSTGTLIDMKELSQKNGSYAVKIRAVPSDNDTAHSISDYAELKNITFTGSPTITSITVNDSSQFTGTSAVQTAFVIGINGADKSVHWTVSGQNSPYTSINTDGLLTIGNDETANAITVKATSVQEATKTAAATVTVCAMPKASAPGGVQLSDTGLAVWNKVEDAVGYSLQIYNDNLPYGEMVVIDGNETVKHQFTLDLSGSYSFKIKALGNGKDLADSDDVESNKVNFTSSAVITGVAITPEEHQINRGESLKFTAVVNGTGSLSQKVTWSVTGGTSAQTIIDGQGSLSVGGDELSKTLEVKATSIQDTTKSGCVQVTVEGIPDALAKPSSLIFKNGKGSWTASPGSVCYQVCLFKDSKALGSWVIADTSCDFTNQLTESGSYTFKVVAIGDGLSHSNSPEAVSGVYQHIVTTTVTGVTIIPQSVSLNKEGTQLFAAAVQGTGNPSQDVSWRLEGNNSSATTLSNEGLLTIGRDETAVTLSVSVAATADNTKMAAAVVTITSAQPLPTPQNLKWEGETAKWDAVEHAVGYTVALYNSNEKLLATYDVAQATSVDLNDKLTVTGDYIFSVMAKGDSKSYADSSIVKSEAHHFTAQSKVTGVTINPAIVTLKQGGIQQFTARVQGSDNPPQSVEWSIAGTGSEKTTLSDTGLLTVAADESVTQLTVKATSTLDKTYFAQAAVTIQPADPDDPIDPEQPDKPTAETVKEQISHLPETITAADKTAVAAVKEQFDSLQPEEWQQLDQEMLTKLESAILATGNIVVEANGMNARGLGLLAAAEEIRGEETIRIVLEANNEPDENERQSLLVYIDQNQLTAGAVYDIRIIKTVGDGAPQLIGETAVPVSVSFELREADQGKTDYQMLRFHNGKMDTLALTVTGSTGSFACKKFSTYALAYKDNGTLPEKPGDGNNPPEMPGWGDPQSSVKPSQQEDHNTTPTTQITTEQKDMMSKPVTGIFASNQWIYIVIGIVMVIMIGITLLVYRKKHSR